MLPVPITRSRKVAITLRVMLLFSITLRVMIPLSITRSVMATLLPVPITRSVMATLLPVSITRSVMATLDESTMPTQPPSLLIDLFDPDQDVGIVYRRLPHWSQAGTLCFITWRTFDSIPAAVLQQWLDERKQYLERYGIDPSAEDWGSHLNRLPLTARNEFHRRFSDRWNDHLDACHGACVLRRPELSRIVADSLRHFDNQRYNLTDFVIMPNHVHVLVAFPDEDSLLKQCESWKHFTATQINRHLGQKGRFWQQDGFDHLVRSQKQFDHLRSYIADNPRRANLGSGEFVHFSKTLEPSRGA